jgi:hypothetical protein
MGGSPIQCRQRQHNGNSYSGRLLELGPTTIRVEGCAIGICGGQNMSRIK